MSLRRGSRGEDVKKLQEGLAFLGFHPGPVDGIFGSSTIKAVEQFQKSNKLIEDGIFGRSSLKVYTELLEDKAVEEFGIDFPKSVEPKEDKQKLSWVKCPADSWASLPPTLP